MMMTLKPMKEITKMKSIDDNPIDKIASKKPEDITKEDVDILVDWILGIKAGATRSIKYDHIEFDIGDLCIYIPVTTYTNTQGMTSAHRNWDKTYLGLIYDIGVLHQKNIHWMFDKKNTSIDIEAMAAVDKDSKSLSCMLRVLAGGKLLEDWAYYFHPYIKVEE